MIWQLKDSKSLLLYWKLSENTVPHNDEHNFIKSFKDIYKKRPFANLGG